MKKKIEHILKKALGGKAEFDIFIPEQEAFGHYSTNAALRLAQIGKKPPHQKLWYGGKNPLEIAGQIVAKIEKIAPRKFFEKIEIANPGFINFWISKDTFQKEFADIVKKKEKFGRSSIGAKKTVIFEYSGPNIAKRMHMGHLRSTIIGDALANTFEFLGYNVVRWNYIGDWGTQFGKMIAAYKLWGDKKKIEKNPLDELQKLYVRFHDEMKKNSELEARGQEEFKKLETGDRENRALWQWFRKESLKEFKKIYARLGIRFNIFVGESFYEKDLKPLVAELLKKGIAEKSEGSVIVSLEKFGLAPALIQKSDGASLYLTRDIPNIRYRVKKFRPDSIFYVVGNEQSFHFQQLFKIAEIIGIKKTKLVHIKHGFILGEQGKKLATREGRTILFDEILKKSINLAHKVVQKKNPELNEKEKSEIAEAVGIGALKYGDLKENRNSDISFDWDRMLDFRGDSAPYIQYTYARLKSILRKAGKFKSGNAKFLNGENEYVLIRKIIEFSDVVEESARMLLTNNLAKYLYELSNAANRYYESTPILNDNDKMRRNARLALVSAASAVLKSGLGLLGIKAPEKI